MGSEGGEGGGRARQEYVQFEDRNRVCTARSSPLRLRKYGLNWYVTVPTHGQRHRMTLHTSNTGSGIWIQDQGPRSNPSIRFSPVSHRSVYSVRIAKEGEQACVVWGVECF